MYAAVKCLLVLTAAIAAHGFNLRETDVVFHVFTRDNPVVSDPLLASPISIMSGKAFSADRRTYITIHSQNDHVGGNFNAFVVPAHLEALDVNVVAVDWSPGAAIYSNALGNAPQVGEIVAKFINILNSDFGYGPDQIRIVGVGLGAHIAGIAGRKADGYIPRIVAIDPALHGWTHHPDILNPDDADSVEVLHATAGNYGFDFPLGDIDFYANGGSHQTGCGSDVSCSHVYAYAFYSESIRSELEGGEKFVATACDSYEQAIAQECSGSKDTYFGGIDDKLFISGIFWFRTNAEPPFATG